MITGYFPSVGSKTRGSVSFEEPARSKDNYPSFDNECFFISNQNAAARWVLLERILCGCLHERKNKVNIKGNRGDDYKEITPNAEFSVVRTYRTRACLCPSVYKLFFFLFFLVCVLRTLLRILRHQRMFNLIVHLLSRDLTILLKTLF